jgi:hypothetical protein
MSKPPFYGPWSLSEDSQELFSQGERVYLYDSEGTEIAELSPSFEEWSYGEVLRVHLAAAAPDLLAACKLALNAFEKNWAVDWGELEQAIAKAEGRTTPPGRAEASPTEPQNPTEAKS